jgi:glycosyltransferase involved in cell wall biosynthesis
MLPVTIWMNMPSFYQDDLFDDLARKVDLRVVYDHGLTEDRRQLGWTEPKGRYSRRILEPGRKISSALRIARSEVGRVHVINGIWAEAAFIAAALALGKVRATFSIYAECPDDTISRSPLRRGARTVIGRSIARRAQGLFAVSHFAVDYFTRFGFRKEHIYPFGYFRATPTADADRDDEIVNLVYVGQLIRRKGVDILLQALAPLCKAFPKVRLSLIGLGPEQEYIASEVQANGLVNHVTLEGMRASSEIHKVLGRASGLILPSRWDGWGLVINEALSAGVPVIASDRCGAADLILHGVNGYIFRSEDVDSLRICLCRYLSSHRKQMRAAALRTGSALTIPVVTDYFVECLEHLWGGRITKPTPPWEVVLRQLQSESKAVKRGDHTNYTPAGSQKSA